MVSEGHPTFLMVIQEHFTLPHIFLADSRWTPRNPGIPIRNSRNLPRILPPANHLPNQSFLVIPDSKDSSWNPCRILVKSVFLPGFLLFLRNGSTRIPGGFPGIDQES